MQPLVLLPFLVASAFAGHLLGAGPIVHYSIEPVPQYNQIQNTATGEYGYSYHGGPSSKTEFRATDGTTTGTYSYVDAHGILQTVNYIADELGFRAAGSNIPSEGSVPLEAPDVAAAKAAHLAKHSRATLEALSHHRKKRGVILSALPVAHVAIPIATSSQHHVQIHNRGHLLTPSLLYRKKRSIVGYAAPLPASSAKILSELSHQSLFHPAPVAIATPVASHFVVESLPLASSSESRFQIHNGAKYVQEIAAPIVQAKAALPTSYSFVKSLPLATSSQSRFQIHNGAKYVQEIAAPIVEAKATLPIASYSVVHSLPLATSSQRRFQIHNGAKIIQEYYQPLLAATPVHAASALPAFAPVHAPALPAGPIHSGSPNHEFAGAAALPAKPASASDDAITVESV